MAEEVEPLAGHAAIVEPVLAAELDHEPLPHVLGAHLDDLTVALLEDLLPADLETAVTVLRLQVAELALEDLDLGDEVALVLGKRVVRLGD